MQNAASLGLKRAGVKFFEFLIQCLEGELVNIVRYRQLFDPLLQPRDLLFR